jgi:hypothetical protein
MAKTNKDKNPVIDESILEETPPNINEPQTKEDEVIEEPKEESKEEPKNEEPVADKPTEKVEETPEVPAKTEETPRKEETQDEKDKRYKAQQTEVQIQTARNRALIDKVTEANNLPEPTVDELKAFVAQDGVSWDELTTFERSMARRTFINERRSQIVTQAVESTKKIDEWAQKVDEFIDSTDGKPEFVKLSSNEVDFRRFAMQEAHRGVPIDILLGAFLNNLPATPKKRDSIFQTGGGGEKVETPTSITNTDTIAQLRTENPREYRRLLKQGKIQAEV